MIYTSNYDNFKNTNFNTISISGDKGKSANYNKEYCSIVAPKKDFWTTWHNNINILSKEENNLFYIESYYKEVLSKLNPKDIYNLLDNKILLCYEKNNEFCHRHILTAWLEIYLNIKIDEIILKDNNIITIDKPIYIKEQLIRVMKKAK